MEGVVDFPADAAERYRRAGYWKGIPLCDAFAASIETCGDTRIAVVDGTRTVTYAELGRLVDRMALHFVELGICDGARVVVQLPNALEFVVVYLACLRAGAILVACLPTHRQTEIEYLANHTQATAWVVPSEFRGFDFVAMAASLRPKIPSLRHVLVVGPRAESDMLRVEALMADPIEQRVALATLEHHKPRASEPAVFQLSGGTTGLPKVIPRTHDDYLYNSLAFAEKSAFGRDDTLLVPVPIAHNFPLACPGVQGALLLGARVVLAPSPSAETVFPLVQQHRVTWIPAVPATVVNWLAHPRRPEFDFSSLRVLCVGGQRLLPEAAEQVFETFGPVLVQVYGMAEGLLCCTRQGDPREVIVNTQGRPICDDDEVRVVDDVGRPVEKGELGELQVRGPYTIRGYYKAEEYNRGAFTADGFYSTGDLVRMHPSGNYVVEGRSKDVINRGGEKIGAEELENLILSHVAVQNVAVVGMPDRVLGERPCAFVVLEPGSSLSLPELVGFLKHRIASFKLPERLEVRPSLPLTHVGKISKKALREEIAKLVAKA